ncbi:MAG: Fe-S cluster assembly protein SufD [Roseiarcus sp.]
MNVRIVAPKTIAETTIAAQFAALQTADSDRAAAFAAFAATGLPTRRDEAWHYTDLRSLMSAAAPIANAPDAARIEAARQQLAARERVGDVRLVLVDGRFVPQLSDAAPKGVFSGMLAKSVPLTQPDAVVALNDAFAMQGLALDIDAGVELAERIEIAHCASADAPHATYSRVHVLLLAGAQARIVESYFGAGADCQRNALTKLSLNKGARCEHVSVVADDAGLHLESQIADLGADAEFNSFALVAGGALTRRQTFATLGGEGAKIALGGLSLLDGRRHADTTLLVDHAAPRGRSREFYKHIVADEATGVYQGKVVVRSGAQKTDGGMKSQAILLSPHAVMNNKPELEIFADDVICGHGATVGALDPEQMFYLQARGLPEVEAEAMLLEAFGADAIARVEDEELAEWLRRRMRAWLAARAEGARS